MEKPTKRPLRSLIINQKVFLILYKERLKILTLEKRAGNHNLVEDMYVDRFAMVDLATTNNSVWVTFLGGRIM